MVEAPVPEGPQLGLADRSGPSRIIADWLAAERLLLVALVGLVVALPLLPARWTPPILTIGAGLLVLGRLVLAAAGREPLVLPFRRVAAASVPFLLATGWCFFQASGLAPSGWHHPLWSLAADALGLPLAGRVSLDPAATYSGAALLLAHVGLFWTALELGRKPPLARIAVTALAVAGAAASATCLVGEALGRSFGRFGDVEPAASLAALAVLAALALILDRIVEATEPGMRARRALRVAARTLAGRGLVSGIALVSAALASGILAAPPLAAVSIAAILFFLLMVLAAPGLRFGGHRPILAAGVVGVAALVAATALGAAFVRGAAVERSGGAASAAALHAAERDALAVGVGIGTFDAAIRAYDDVEEGSAQAAGPSLYARLAVEAGAPACAGFALASLALAAILAGGLIARRRHAAYPALGLAATLLLGALAAVSNGLAPALTAGYALVVAIGCAQSFKTRRG